MMLLYTIAVLQLLSLTGASESGIVGGKECKPHSRRYMVSLQVRGQHVCGGVLIRKDFVLTSAHCKLDNMWVVLGAHNIRQRETSQQKIPVAEYHPHHYYDHNDDKNSRNDIMLLKLKRNAKLNKEVKTIGLPKSTEKIRAGTKCSVAGWGRTDPTSPTSNVLRETTVEIKDNKTCLFNWQYHFSSGQMICTHTDGKRQPGICQGDSGGPLICADKLQGISAYTLRAEHGGCDDPSYPHVFMKVSSFIKWITTKMKEG